MAPSVKIRSSQGCWTCRLRRKKCDERKPVCSICDSLEITCHYSDKKPEWMDGGSLEKAKADELKNMVKVKANGRRERKWAQGYDVDEFTPAPPAGTCSESDHDIILSQTMESNMVLHSSTERDAAETSGTSSNTPATSVTDESEPGYSFLSLHTGVPVAGMSPSAPFSTEDSSTSAMGPEVEANLNFSSLYMDYVFPFMLPFYRPSILEGGRGWLLVLLLKNKALFHTANSIASYFFAVILAHTHSGHEQCKMSNWHELQRQQDLAIKALQHDMQCVNKGGVAGSFEYSLRCFQSVVQMLIFEITIANTENWQVHLDAASTLYEQIIECHSTDTLRPFYSLLARLNSLTVQVRFHDGGHPWCSDQNAMRFLTLDLLWKDIIASTALGCPPKLRRFHQELLEGDNPELRSEEFFGPQNWVILAIGHIAELDAWKKEMRSNGVLSVVELVQRAGNIEARLRAGIASLNTIPMDLSEDPCGYGPTQPYSGFKATFLTESWKDRHQLTPAQAFYTKIWAQSALTYLSVVVSGFQPALAEIQTNVAVTMDLFRIMPSPLCIRTVVWPFAITGCLSLPGQEPFFRDLVSSMGPIQVFGGIKEALNIMNTVWEHRSCMDPELWDISACLGVLGRKPLLV